MPKLFEILHEDDDLLVVNKPAGLVCHPTKTDEYSSLIGRVRLHLGLGTERRALALSDESGKSGISPRKFPSEILDTAATTIYAPHLVNRLDRETSGVVIVAKNPEAAGQLGKLFEARAVEKEYFALVNGRVR